jgi:hypothetical protein
MAASGGTSRLYNLITIVMVALTVIVILAVVALIIVNPGKGEKPAAVQPPTVFVIPSETPTLPGPTVNPTWTVTPTTTETATPTITSTPAPTRTPTPTDTATPTQTLTPTNTLTATLTPTKTNTPLPTNTRTAAPFDYEADITYRKNFANKAGCDWAGIGGTAVDLSNKHVVGLIVHVWGGGIDDRVITGSNTKYGTSGWERSVNNKPTDGLFRVQLESPSGTLLSDVIDVQMKKNCDKNLAEVAFEAIQ